MPFRYLMFSHGIRQNNIYLKYKAVLVQRKISTQRYGSLRRENSDIFWRKDVDDEEILQGADSV